MGKRGQPHGKLHPNWLGNKASIKAGRLRALRMFPATTPCERCGKQTAERHHKDGNTLNNARDNIRFLCRRCHMIEDGRLGTVGLANRGRKHPNHSRFIVADVTAMKRLRETGLSQAKLAAMFNTTQSQISRLLLGKRNPSNGTKS
jgi:ribosome-binding protein aMBF1 (putative translation factor)